MKKVLLVLIIATCFFECQRDISYKGTGDTGVSVNPDPITAGLQGLIVDENGLPSSGVTVTIGTSNFITDANGFFHSNSLSLDKNTTLVTAQKDGYFKAYRVFAATSGTNQVVIKLIKRSLAGTVSASSGGDASLSNGSKISLPANGVVIASNGAAYTGDIKVFAAYIDPKSSDINKTIPGSFVANDKNGKRVLLSSYGMLAVELESSAGEKLQIKDGSVATLKIPIPASSVASAPSTISLWYVDDATGIWKEEGNATKQGNIYTGTVKHFSFWNCDYPMNAVNISLTLKTPDSLPLVNTEVRITAATTDSTQSAYGWTDSLGQVRGLVPANEGLSIDVINYCGNIIFSKNIAPLTQDADLGTIVLSASNDLLTYTGRLIDCSGNAVKNGYALINFGDEIRYVSSNASGVFTINFVTCSGVPATSTVLGVDNDAQQQGQLTTIAVTQPVTNAGNITACGTIVQQFINYSLDSVNYSITSSANDSLVGTTYDTPNSSTETSIYGIQRNNINNSIKFVVNGQTTPTKVIIHLYVQSYSIVTLVPLIEVTFTNFPSNVGEYYEGSFSGQFTDSLSKTHTVSSTFKVRRNF